MRILVVSQYFDPEPFRVSDVCRDLVRRGHEVTVLCGIPNYPAGRYYPGYSAFRKRVETVDGIHVVRSWLIPRGQGGKVGLVLNYLSFLVTAWLRHFRLARRGFDAVFCYEVSPLTMALPAVAIARRAGIPLTLYLTDLWPENVEAVNGIRNRRILQAIGRMAGYIYRHCDRILIPSRPFADSMRTWGAPPERMAYWPQYAEDFYTPSQNGGSEAATPSGPNLVPVSGETVPPEALAKSTFPVVFTGNIGKAQGLDILIETAGLLRRDSGVVFYLVGDGRARKELEEKVRAAGSPAADRIVFCGRVPARRVPDYLAHASAALLTMSPDPVFSLYLPTKMQTYLASGLPILCAADGAPADMVLEAGAGVTAGAGDAAGLAAAVERMASLAPETRHGMGRAARAYFEREFSKTRLMDELEHWLSHPLAGDKEGNCVSDWTAEQLHRLQDTEMEILKILDGICVSNKVRYYLASGTCLGAMRHGGMIPWDDDIDVYLHRDDYERLLSLLPGLLPPGYFLQTMETDPEYLYTFAKIRKDGTAFVQEALRDIPMHHGIYIDLFPVDGAPRGAIARQIQRAKLFFLKRVSIGHILPRRAERMAYGILYRFCSRKKFLRMYDRYCRRYDSARTGLCLAGTSDYAYRREMVPRSVYGEGRRVPFGTLSLPVPDDADTYLSTMYGDWRTPPPEADRLSQHAPWRIDFEHEYHPCI